MSKRRFSDAFPTLGAAYSIFNSAYNSFKRQRTGLGSYILKSNGTNPMARIKRRLGIRSRSRYVRRRKFRRGRRTLTRRIRRIWSFMRKKGLRNLETKYIQGTITAGTALGSNRCTILNNADSITAKAWLTDIDEGTQKFGRVGQKVFIKALKLRWFFTAPPRLPASPPGGLTFVPQECHIRVIVVREKEALGDQPTNVTPTIYHFYQNNLSTDSTDPTAVVGGDSRLQFISMFKYYDSKFSDNYTVLMDRTIKVANEDGGDRYYRMMRKNIQVNQPCHWDSQGNRGDGHIYVFWFCDITSVNETAGFIPNVMLSYRTTYTDV